MFSAKVNLKFQDSMTGITGGLQRIPKILNISQEELDIEMDNKKIRMDIISILKKELQ